MASVYARAASEYDPFARSLLPSAAASAEVRPASANAGVAKTRRERVSTPTRMTVNEMSVQVERGLLFMQL